MNERRKQFGCPMHDKVFLCRQGEKIICVAYNCKWEAPARRYNDIEIKTLQDIKTI